MKDIEQVANDIRAYMNLGNGMYSQELKTILLDTCSLCDEYQKLEQKLAEADELTEIGKYISDLPVDHCFIHTDKEFLVREMKSKFSPSYRGSCPLTALEKFRTSTRRKSKPHITEDTDD